VNEVAQRPPDPKDLLPFRQQPINRSNLILFAQALFKAINKLHRQKNRLIRYFGQLCEKSASLPEM
jgi:hypothetical protein